MYNNGLFLFYLSFKVKQKKNWLITCSSKVCRHAKIPLTNMIKTIVAVLNLKEYEWEVLKRKKKKNSNSSNNYNNNNNNNNNQQACCPWRLWSSTPSTKRGNDCPLLPLFIFTSAAGLEKANSCFRSDHVITYTGCYALEYYVERGQSQ